MPGPVQSPFRFHITYTRTPENPNEQRRLRVRFRRLVWLSYRGDDVPPLFIPSRRCDLSQVSDYTLAGEHKIAQQARRNATFIRCPRDSAVMRVTAWRAERIGSPDVQEVREFARFPRSPDWQVCELDVECPACRRRAVGVTLTESTAPS